MGRIYVCRKRTPHCLDAQRIKVTGDPRRARSAADGASVLTERLGVITRIIRRLIGAQ